MSKFLIIPDSFKGSLTSKAVCEIIEDELTSANLTEYISFSASDGGEGFLDFLEVLSNSKKIFINSLGPNFNNINSYYLYDSTNKIAYIESAKTIGLSLATKQNPLLTTTYGLGQQILAALNQEVDTIYIGLGGSSTNDAGLGALSALGVEFYDENNDLFIPVGGTIENISKINYKRIDPRLKNIKIYLLCDVLTSLYGLNGAAYIFAPQKGANFGEVITLDNNLRYLHNFLKSNNFKVNHDFPGAGAAGGIPYGFKAFLPVEICSGSQFFLDLIDFKNIINDFDYIITGEGRLDETSFEGKLVSYIVKESFNYHKKVVLFVGSMANNITTKYLDHIEVYTLTNTYPVTDKILKDAKVNLKYAIRKFINNIK